MSDDKGHSERGEDSAVSQFDEYIGREAKGYRGESQPPAGAMWSRIEGEVASAIRAPGRRMSRRVSWLAAGVGIAAALVIGVAIGRRSMTGEGAGVAVAPPSPSNLLRASTDSVRASHMHALTLSHFAQAEVFLTEVRADLRTGRFDAGRSDRSRELLARTRLIMASDAQPAPAVEQLLQDLELVLAGIAALPDTGQRRPTDVRMLDEQHRVAGVLPRIRTILPPPTTAGGSE